MARPGTNIVALVLGAALLPGGCLRPSADSSGRMEQMAWRQPAWGPQAQGLQCRLRPTRRVWHVGEEPTFKVDLRNEGPRVFAFLLDDRAPLASVSVDGRWYPQPAPPLAEGRAWRLGPGAEVAGLHFSLGEQLGDRLTPGRHIVQIAFSLEGVQTVSGPVGIEVSGTR